MYSDSDRIGQNRSSIPRALVVLVLRAAFFAGRVLARDWASGRLLLRRAGNARRAAIAARGLLACDQRVEKRNGAGVAVGVGQHKAAANRQDQDQKTGTEPFTACHRISSSCA